MNKVSSKHHWENVWKFSNNKESYNFPPSRIERAKDKLKTFIYNEYYFSPGDKVLEAGCGDGAILFKLIEKYKIEGHGIDISENAKSIATEYMIKTGIKFKYVIGDVQKLPYPQNTFDTVISLGVIEHFLNPDKVMNEMYRVLKTNGHLILMTPNKYSFGILDKKIKILLKVWKFGYQTEYSVNNLEEIANKYGFKVVSRNTELRKTFKNDSISFKLISSIDQILNVFNKNFGFYSYIYLIKEVDINDYKSYQTSI
ncbi:class I SAM-dependent methyltransferase [Staphylococcus hominis]|uniref:class I SAM-dependent methyltransferase n=1 Tax=Staphylococcus hominis TaxID=1290 RepID=UPI001C3D4653|nr:methyltransferase domain-containing protein [Staphylococcus hominis]MBV5220705.1 methyltransferase domain-containing protein [Staphylococcus hominis]WRY66085.1 methyltransferase domain-containing protein [Staphylococcus hominis]